MLERDLTTLLPIIGCAAFGNVSERVKTTGRSPNQDGRQVVSRCPCWHVERLDWTRRSWRELTGETASEALLPHCTLAEKGRKGVDEATWKEARLKEPHAGSLVDC